MRKKYGKLLIAAMILLPVIVSFFTKNPSGTSVKSPYYGVSQVTFLTDLTFQRDGETVREQSILTEELGMIAAAQDFILMDMFLFNDAYDKEGIRYPDLAEQISTALIAKKNAMPQMPVIFITDPINGFYGAYQESHLRAMADSGIIVVETDLDKLRDSNFLYSGYYRFFIKPFGSGGKGWIANPFDKTAPKVNVRSVLKLANFKANHRKVLVTEEGALITSANPHDASAYHSNVAVKVKSPVVSEIIEGERTVAQFSGTILPELNYKASPETALFDTEVRYLTEKGIYDGLMEYIAAAGEGDRIDIGIFYISDFDLVRGLREAAERGAVIRVVADPNRDAFGIEKDGSPNRTVLSRLQAGSENIQVRWYDTHGEQYHTKMAIFTLADRSVTILGSGNYTRRNLKGYNLEGNLEIVTGGESAFAKETAAYFQRIWNNEDGEFTVDFSQYEESSILKLLKYWLQESTGLCTY